MALIPQWPLNDRRETLAGTVSAVGVATRLHGDRHRLGLVLGRTRTSLRLAGEIDIAAVDDLTTLLEQVDSITMTITVDMLGVTFIDSTGIAPLVYRTDLRSNAGLGSLLIGDRSRQAQFFLDVVGLGGNPALDVAAWERLVGPAPIGPSRT